jgi:hypothetical protein
MNKNILLNDVQMDTQTAFFMNGDINVFPMPYEAEKTPITTERKLSYKGRITVMDDGNTQVKAYNIGSQGPRYKELFATEHCSVQLSQGGDIREVWKFDKKIPIFKVWEIRRREKPLVDAYFLTIKEDLTWK